MDLIVQDENDDEFEDGFKEQPTEGFNFDQFDDWSMRLSKRANTWIEKFAVGAKSAANKAK